MHDIPPSLLAHFSHWAAGHDVGAPGDTFASCGLTLRVKWPRVQADLAYGLPLIQPAFVAICT